MITLSNFLDKKIESFTDLKGENFTPEQVEEIATRFHIDMNNENIKRDLRVFKLLYVFIGIFVAVATYYFILKP